MDKIKLLYVDDEEINLFLFEEMMEDKYEVLLAYNGMQGLEMLKQNMDIEVIVSDLKMPKMSGLEMIYEAKKIKPDIPCFILSGFEMIEDIRKAMKMNIIIKYFMKPADWDRLDRTIKNFVHRE